MASKWFSRILRRVGLCLPSLCVTKIPLRGPSTLLREPASADSFAGANFGVVVQPAAFVPGVFLVTVDADLLHCLDDKASRPSSWGDSCLRPGAWPPAATRRVSGSARDAIQMDFLQIVTHVGPKSAIDCGARRQPHSPKALWISYPFLLSLSLKTPSPRNASMTAPAGNSRDAILFAVPPAPTFACHCSPRRNKLFPIRDFAP